MTLLSTLYSTGNAGAMPDTWVSGTSYVVGDDVWSPASKHVYRCLVNTSGTTDPSADGTNWGLVGSGGIKSIQRGLISINGASSSGTSTVTAVNTSKSMLMFLGFRTEGNADATHSPTLALTNTTTITATRRSSGTSGDLTYVAWQLVEFFE